MAHRLRTRRVALLYGVGAIALVGWTVYLGDSLPDRNVAQHWNAAWVGLDVLIVLALANTAWRALRADSGVVIAAAASAALLVADAWMDVTTATRADLWQSLLLAAAVELPLAALSVIVARRALLSLSERAPLRPASHPRARPRSSAAPRTHGERTGPFGPTACR